MPRCVLRRVRHFIFIGPVISFGPAGRAVYTSGPAATAGTFATVAYDPATGAPLSMAPYTDGAGLSNASVVSPDRARVFVGAESASAVNTETHAANYDIDALGYASKVGPAASIPETPSVPGLVVATLVVGAGARRRRHRG